MKSLKFDVSFPTARSPIFSHTNGTISGLATIRACNAQQILMDEFNAHQDVNISASYLFYASARALSFWLEATCFFYLFAAIVTFFVVDSCEYILKYAS